MTPPKGVKVTMSRAGPPPMKKNHDYLNPGQDDQMEITGYVKDTCKTVCIWTLIVLTVGFLRLFFYWLPHWFVWATHRRVSVDKAEVVVMKDQYDQWFVSKVVTERDPREQGIEFNENIQTRTGSLKSSMKDKTFRYFITKKVKYIWDKNLRQYQKLSWLSATSGCSYIHQCTGISAEEQQLRRHLFGINSIRVHVTPIITLLIKQALSPFYIFQLFSCILWYVDQYEYYASCIVALSVLSITVFIYQTRAMQRALRNTIHSSNLVTVCRGNNEFDQISSEDLVPGDVIAIPRTGCIMQCDAALIHGNCILNESMLTGESVPVTKTPLPNPVEAQSEDQVFTIKDHSRHILFCGTHVIQTRYYGDKPVLAVVFRTGFSTAKGSLVRSILYPKPVDFKFNQDTYIFVGILFCIALMGFIYTVVLNVLEGEAAGDIALEALDLITIAVPPALPAALTVGIVFAQQRLKKKQIFCISPNSINVSGTINTFCFDKTGTLTEDGLLMQSVHPANDGKFESEVEDMTQLQDTPVENAMATCHSLTIIENEVNGDPLDLIMFDATGYSLEEPGEETSRFDMMTPTVVIPPESRSGKQRDEIGILRQFTFSSSLQRMSVITRKISGKNFELYTKGAPEMIASLSRPKTVPSDFHEVLMSYTRHGYRVLALAWRPLADKLNYSKIQRLQREQVEKSLTFLGLLVMENKLKPETPPIIDELKEANIKTVMVTGDNMLTALSVARECHMVGREDKIILVQAFPPQGVAAAQVEFINADDNRDDIHDIVHKEDGIFKIDMEQPDQKKAFHFAVEGKSWGVLRNHFPELLAKLAVRGTIYARMSPDQKAQLIEVLQDLGYFVGMCGDGANDCGALKAAHAGISLSEAEASVASPFTSKEPNIRCVSALIREGRAALVTSFGVFQYMALYSLCQFTSVCILYWISSNLSDFQFLYIDLFLITSLAVTFGYTASYDKLHKDPPILKLFGVGPILSIISQTVLMALVQTMCYLMVMREPWFLPFQENDEELVQGYENMAIFLSSGYQYITFAIIFAKGAPYRRHMFSNLYFIVNLVICYAISFWINIYPTQPVADFLELEIAPSVPYRFLYVGVGAGHLLLALVIQTFVIDSELVSRRFQSAVEMCFSRSSFKYKILDEEINMSPDWPPLSRSTGSLAQIFERMDSMGQHFVHDNLAFDKDIEEEDFEMAKSANVEFTLDNDYSNGYLMPKDNNYFKSYNDNDFSNSYVMSSENDISSNYKNSKDDLIKSDEKVSTHL